jgi:hypothetical protein
MAAKIEHCYWKICVGWVAFNKFVLASCCFKALKIKLDMIG